MRLCNKAFLHSSDNEHSCSSGARVINQSICSDGNFMKSLLLRFRPKPGSCWSALRHFLQRSHTSSLYPGCVKCQVALAGALCSTESWQKEPALQKTRIPFPKKLLAVMKFQKASKGRGWCPDSLVVFWSCHTIPFSGFFFQYLSAR